MLHMHQLHILEDVLKIDLLVILNRLPTLEVQSVRDGPVVGVALVNVRVPGGQMRGDEAKAGIE